MMTKPTPLKNKQQDNNEIQNLNYEGNIIEFFEEKDIRNAVNWLKQKIHHHHPCSIMSICKSCLIIELVDEAFSDVTKEEESDV